MQTLMEFIERLKSRGYDSSDLMLVSDLQESALMPVKYPGCKYLMHIIIYDTNEDYSVFYVPNKGG